MEIDININGRLNIDPGDLERAKNMGPDELLRIMILNNSKIKTKVSEVYQKKEA